MYHDLEIENVSSAHFLRYKANIVCVYECVNNWHIARFKPTKQSVKSN